MTEAIEMRARALEIDKLLDLNERERGKLNDEIARLTAKRDAMISERSALLNEQTALFRKLAGGAV